MEISTVTEGLNKLLKVIQFLLCEALSILKSLQSSAYLVSHFQKSFTDDLS